MWGGVLEVEEIKCEQVGQIEGTFESTGRVYSYNGLSPTINTCGGGQREPNNRVIEPIIYDDYNGRIKADQSAIGTLTTNCGSDAERNGVKIIEPTIWGSLQEHCAVKKNGICPTLTGAMGMGGGQIPVHNYGYRIRKLTPKECWRLMGVKDEDYEKVAKNQSNASLYHLAGDSIVVNVLMAIFKEML